MATNSIRLDQELMENTEIMAKTLSRTQTKQNGQPEA